MSMNKGSEGFLNDEERRGYLTKIQEENSDITASVLSRPITTKSSFMN